MEYGQNVQHLGPGRCRQQSSDARATKQKEPGTLWSYHTSPGLFKLNYYIRKNSLACLNFYNLGDSSIAFTPLFTSPPNPALSFPTASTCGSCRRATFRRPATLPTSPHQEGSFISDGDGRGRPATLPTSPHQEGSFSSDSDGRGRKCKVSAFFLCPDGGST